MERFTFACHMACGVACNVHNTRYKACRFLTVYGRFFRLYMYTALAPIPLSSFAGEGTSIHGKAFIKSYIGVCMEGAVIVLALLIFSAVVSSNEPGLVAGSVVTQVWAYIGELIFNMLVLVGAVKGADRIAKEMLGT